MNIENRKIHSDYLSNSKIVEVGSLTKYQLIKKMKEHYIYINELGERLLADDKFTTSDKKYSLETTEITVGELGFTEGATILQIFNRAFELGWELCPLELGPHLRMKYLDQPEGFSGNDSHQQAPFGSITIASKFISEDDDFPKGFYLRKINGVLWLRGYTADHLHVWNPNDHFIFCKQI